VVSIPKYHYKDVKGSRVAICVPVRDYVTAAFSYSLANLMRKCGETEQKVSLHMVMGSEVAMQRQQLVDEALETDCTHILWLDSDMNFPVNVLHGLLSHNLDIVACNYSTRVAPHRPVAFKTSSDLDIRVFDGTGLEEIYAVGMGCMLVKRSVYETISRPYYSVNWNDDYTSLVGEDIYFCNKIKEHGYKIFLEHDLSKKIAHVGTRAYTIKGDCND
jgi:hypothetical protein